MSEKKNNIENQNIPSKSMINRPTNRWAIASYALAPLGMLGLIHTSVTYARGVNPLHAPLLWRFCGYGLCTLAPIGIICGIIALIQIRRSQHLLKGINHAIAGIVLGVLVILTVAWQYPLFLKAGRSMWGFKTSCLNNLKQIGQASILYAKDNDGKFPSPDSWNEDIKRYLKSPYVLVCPQAPNAKIPTYAMNPRLKGLRIKDVKSPADTVLFFESIPGRNLAGDLELIPSSLPHSDSINICFVDGHTWSCYRENLRRLNWDPRKKASSDTER